MIDNQARPPEINKTVASDGGIIENKQMLWVNKRNSVGNNLAAKIML